jgi:hypothetical protein
MRKAQVCCVAVLFVAFATLSNLLPCPFLGSVSPRHSSLACCPSQSSPAERCPLSNTAESCPFFITEWKLGIAQARVIPVVFSIPASTVQLPILLAARDTVAELRVLDKAGTHLKNRTLRI